MPETPERRPALWFLLGQPKPLYPAVVVHRRPDLGSAQEENESIGEVHCLHCPAAALRLEISAYQCSLPSRYQARKYPHTRCNCSSNTGNCKDMRFWMGRALPRNEKYKVRNPAISLPGGC